MKDKEEKRRLEGSNPRRQKKRRSEKSQEKQRKSRRVREGHSRPEIVEEHGQDLKMKTGVEGRGKG